MMAPRSTPSAQPAHAAPRTPGGSPAQRVGHQQKISPPRQQPPHTPDELQFAKRTLQKLVQDSRFFPVLDKNNRVQTIKEAELDFGSVIGKGGFCEVRCTSLKYSSWGHPRDRRTNAAIATPEYAMKYLSPSKTSSSRVFQRGIADLAMEACFLSLLRHENIIGLHYVSEGSLEENYNCASSNNRHGDGRGGGQHDEIVMDANGNLQLRRRPQPQQHNSLSYHFFGYFLLLDPLHETLTDRIEKTYVPQILQHNQHSSGANNNNMWDRIRHKGGNNNMGTNPRNELTQRLEILRCVASALRYLHEECHIVFRDIKPDNIGFYRRYHPHCACGYFQSRGNRDGCTCYDEVTKVFDFGLAKELKPKYRKTHPAYPDQDTYKLTGCTGSRRYMAPEVCFSDPYNEKADVYSYGMLLYQVSSLVTPFDGFSMGKHEREVLRGGYRPDVKIPSNSFLKGKKNSSSLSQQEQMILEGGLDGNNAEKKNMLLALKTKRYWPKELPRLMEECWDYDMRYRPQMKEVTNRLDRCIEELVQRNAIGAGGGLVPGHWPKFNNNAPMKEDDAPGTLETSHMSSDAFSHGGGFSDSHGRMMTSPQHQQHLQYHGYMPATTPMAVDSTPAGHPHSGRHKSRARHKIEGGHRPNNIMDQAAYQQQNRRSSGGAGGQEPDMMQWHR